MWSAMANDDFSGEFRRKNEPLSEYWRGVKIALDLPLPSVESLEVGFGQHQGSLLLKLIDFMKMGHCARSLLEMYLMLVAAEIVRLSLFELLKMYMLDTSLQFGL